MWGNLTKAEASMALDDLSVVDISEGLLADVVALVEAANLLEALISTSAEVGQQVGFSAVAKAVAPMLKEKDETFLDDCESGHGRDFAEPPTAIVLTPTVSETLEKKFIRLRDQWKAETAHVSSTTRLVLHPAYQAIIGMGPDVVPLLLRELERRVDNWFWALHAITQADPADPGSQGDGEKIAKAWLAWGKFCKISTKEVARKLGDAMYQRVTASGITDRLAAIWKAGLSDWQQVKDPDALLQEIRGGDE